MSSKYRALLLSLVLSLSLGVLAQNKPTEPASSAAQNPAAAAGQAPTPAMDSATSQRIEQNIRARFKVPASVKVEVSPRKPSEISGYDLVTITLVDGSKHSPHDFYLSKDGGTLAQLSKMDISRDPFDTAGRPSLGPKDAKVTVIVYDDFECPYCARGYKTLMHDLLPDYKDKIRIVYKDFPLYDIHPWAIRAAVDANCLADQNNDAYWDFADFVHGNQAAIKGENRPLPDQFGALDHSALDYGKKHNLDGAKLDACVKAQDSSAVMASSKYGERALGIDATPTIFINGTRFDGAVPAEELRAALNTALQDAGVAVPAGKSGANIINDPNAVKDVMNKLGVQPPGAKAVPAKPASGVSNGGPPPKPN